MELLGILPKVPHDPGSANGSDARGPEAEEPDARLRGSRDDAPSEVREDDGVWAGRLLKRLPRDTWGHGP